MKHVSMVIPEGDVVLGSVVGPVMILNWANEVLAAQGLPGAYTVDVVGTGAEKPTDRGIFAIRPNRRFNELERTDLVLIPAFSGNPMLSIAKNTEAIAWIQRMKGQGAEVASMCTGAFLLAATGLIDGQSCTTHWAVAGLFRQAFKNVDLREERIVTDANGFYSSGGAFSYLSLVMHLLQKFNGPEMAVLAAKTYEVEMGRHSQNMFMVFQGMKDHGDEQVLKAQSLMEMRYAEPLNMETIASELALSARNFNRRFKEATALTPLDYLQRVRIEAAKRQLESGANVNEAMYASGYSDDKAFRSVFKRRTSMSPVHYRARYARAPLSVAA
ncbi:MAG TPA: helix-turn-helix domain-containing protein [Flavobacteriales bacterium]